MRWAGSSCARAGSVGEQQNCVSDWNPFATCYDCFGGWNDCPYDAEHVAVLRYWHERYGVDLFAMGGDIIECVVERPPTTREEALNLAREQLLYAPGTLGEFSGGGSSVPELAAALLNSRHWLFWWD
jgi:hypothetical protein